MTREAYNHGPRKEGTAELCAQDQFLAQARRTPEGTAVIVGRRAVSYGEVRAMAGRLAARLIGSGVGPETTVAILAGRSLDLLVAVVATLLAGGAYVPLNPEDPPARIRAILDDVEPAVLLTERHRLEALPPHTSTVILLDALSAFPDADAPEGRACLDDLAYVMSTSGSSGEAKGVLVDHRGPAAYLAWSREAFPPETVDVVYFWSPVFFDIAFFEIFYPLTTGVPARLLASPLEAIETLKEDSNVLIQAPPGVVEALVRAGVDLSTVRFWKTGGEALPPRLLREVQRQGVSVHNMYGLTEASIASTHFAIPDGFEAGEGIPIGKAIAAQHVRVLGPDLSPVHAGSTGEICIAGAGLSRGYHRRTDLTARTFVASPFPEDGGGRLLKTGDLARLRPDGNLDFVGRADRQVKIRGCRVEPAEVEATLTRHGRVREAAVLPRAAGTAGNILMAYVALTEGDLEGVRAFSRAHLPHSMVPAVFVPVDALPRTATGKVDRMALAENAPHPPAASSDAPSLGPLEQSLADLWKAVLGLPTLDGGDNFFDLGGDSLLAVRLLAEVETAFGKRLPPSTLLERPTLEAMASLLGEATVRETRSCLVPVCATGSRPPFFCVHHCGGRAIGFGPLSRHLPRDLPFFVFRSRGLEEGEEPLDTIEAMASHYVREMRGAQPDGPYYLGGLDWGGVVAYEMARQLSAAGAEVGLLVLLDTFRPVPLNSLPYFYSRFQHHRRTLQDLAPPERAPYFLTLLGGMGHLVIERLGRLLPGARPSKRSAEDRVVSANIRAEGRYAPEPYAGRVALLQSADGPRLCWYGDHLGWDELVKGTFEILPLTANHGRIEHEPHARDVARVLTACLEAAQNESISDPTHVERPIHR